MSLKKRMSYNIKGMLFIPLATSVVIPTVQVMGNCYLNKIQIISSANVALHGANYFFWSLVIYNKSGSIITIPGYYTNNSGLAGAHALTKFVPYEIPLASSPILLVDECFIAIDVTGAGVGGYPADYFQMEFDLDYSL